MTMIRLISHNTPLQWHDCSDGFIERVEAYLLKAQKRKNPQARPDIWVQYQDGRFSITAPR